jgi:AP2 domain
LSMENTQTREIPLSKGQVAIVDAKHYDRIVAMGRWQANFCKDTGSHYALMRKGPRKSKRTFMMHRVVMNAPPGTMVDHIRTGDTLRNTEENLRLATRSQNCAHARMNKRNRSGFKGVSLNKTYGTWRAQVTINGWRWVRHFKTKEEAARAYDAKAKEIYGEFAVLNFPEVAGQSW